MGITASKTGCCEHPGKGMDQNSLQVSPLDNILNELLIVKEKSFQGIESIEARSERYLQKLQIPVQHLQKMTESFVHELEVGLIAHQNHPNDWNSKECSLKMLDACISSLPTGKEKGEYYALDFGGTNFRVVRAELTGDGEMAISKHEQSLMESRDISTGSAKGLLDSKATAKQMFDFFATTVGEFIKKQKEIKNECMAGFTFSFPCNQRRINEAILMHWTKGFETGRSTDDPVEGLDVVELLNVAFRRNQVPVRCNSVLNDTVGTLLSCAYSMDHSAHPPCLVGMILGTGMNCCYYDETAPQYDYLGHIINIECGNFNRDLPRLNVDCELDFKAADTRGFQPIEKMCSGAYLGEVCRLILVRIFAEKTPPLMWRQFSLSTEQIAKIMNDKSQELIVTSKVVMEAWETELNFDLLKIVHRVAIAVMDRSAALASVLVAGCARKTGRLQPAMGGLSVGIDGSLYKRNAWYRERLRFHLDSILGQSIGSLVHLLMADDGSGKGAAILAATLD